MSASHLNHRGVLYRVSISDDASPVNQKSRARRLLLLKPLPRHRPAWKAVRTVNLRERATDRRREEERVGMAGARTGTIVG